MFVRFAAHKYKMREKSDQNGKQYECKEEMMTLARCE